jgi:hypothetical protein
LGKRLYIGDYYIPQVQCAVSFPKVTHKYTKDGKATYAMPGICWGTATDGANRQVNFHVDAVWNPAEETALETGWIYDLGSIWPMFQRGGSTNFVNRYQCKGGDPWLNDSRCGLLGSTAGEELKQVFPRLTQTPYPLMKDAIPVSQRAALKREYQSVIDPFNPEAAKVVQGPPTGLRQFITAKPAPGSPPPPPPPPPPPAVKYGAKYSPASISSLRKGKTATVQVKVTNTGNFAWVANSAFRLSYHWYRGATPVQIGGEQTSLPQTVTPNQQVTLQAKVKAPSGAGTYLLRWDMVQQGVTWFSQKGVPTKDQTVAVK